MKTKKCKYRIKDIIPLEKILIYGGTLTKEHLDSIKPLTISHGAGPSRAIWTGYKFPKGGYI